MKTDQVKRDIWAFSMENVAVNTYDSLIGKIEFENRQSTIDNQQ